MNIAGKNIDEFIERNSEKLCEDLDLPKDFLDPNNTTLSPDMIMELKKFIVIERFKEKAEKQITSKLRDMGFIGGTQCFYDPDDDRGRITAYFPSLGFMFCKNYDFDYDCIKPVTPYDRLFARKKFEDSFFTDMPEIDDFLQDVFYVRKE